jgi:hypothetical protein
MATVAQFGGRGTKQAGHTAAESHLTAEMKDFVRNVLVPILEKEYLALNSENELAKEDADAAHSERYTAAPKLRAVRP